MTLFASGNASVNAIVVPQVGNFDQGRITRSMEEFGPSPIWNYADRTLPNAKSVLSQPLGAICAEVPGLARHLRGIRNLVTAPRTCADAAGQPMEDIS